MRRIESAALTLLALSTPLLLPALPAPVGAQTPVRPEVLWTHDTDG